MRGSMDQFVTRGRGNGGRGNGAPRYEGTGTTEDPFNLTMSTDSDVITSVANSSGILRIPVMLI